LPDEPADPMLVGPAAAYGLALLALLPVAVLIVGQFAAADVTTRVDHVSRAGGETFDTGPGMDRQLTLLRGAVRVEPHQFPVMGSPDAPVVIAEIYDYTCPHCRRLHSQLTA